MIPLERSALVVVGHGSTLNPDSSAPTQAHARAIRQRGIFREVHCGFWKEQPSLREVLRMVEGEAAYVVPHFISEGYFTQTVIPREMELDGPVTRQQRLTVYYCPPVGSHPRMTEVILHRVRSETPGVDPRSTTLIICGHGTSLNDNSARAAKTQVARIQAMRLFGEVLAAYMEEPPCISQWAALARFPDVVVVPFFIADGLHSYVDMPVLLGIDHQPGVAASQAEVFRRNPYHLRGRRLFYTSAIGTEPLVADLIVEQAATFGRSGAPHVLKNHGNPGDPA